MDNPANSGTGAQLYGYSYDQLNRIISMDAFVGFNNTNNSWTNTTPTASSNYKERVSYDANGNIKTYLRNGTTAGGSPLAMDNLTYNYNTSGGKLVNNRLRHVQDAIGDANYADDIDNQAADNYSYDAIGNLTGDVKEGISNITWSVYGKILSVTKTSGTITYTYDASGNRISKTFNGKTTWYVRDASGNVMAVYEQRSDLNSGHLTQTEVHLYGSSRLGIYNINRDMVNPPTGEITIFERGRKFFELSNHLGNLLVTVSDRKIQVDADNNGQIDYYTADIITANDYYPFGMMMPGRKYEPVSGYRYGFNGKEQDKDMNSLTAYDYGFRIYNPAIGRFLSIDPLSRKYPWYTPYQYSGNSPILNIDIDGLEDVSTQPNTQPLNPDERFQEAYQAYQSAASAFRKAANFFPLLRVVQAGAVVVNLFAEYKIAIYSNEKKQAEKEYDETTDAYRKRDLENEANIFYAKEAGIYKDDLSDETNVKNFVYSDQYLKYSRKVDALFNKLENEKYSKLAALVNKIDAADKQLSNWETISEIISELTPAADIKNDFRKIMGIINEKDEKKRFEKILDFVTDKMIDRLFDKAKDGFKDTPENRAMFKAGITKILSNE